MYAPSPHFEEAACDYRWLLDRGYADSAALKLVGDRFQLPREDRMILFRGVAALAACLSRRSLLAERAAGRLLLVDGHNQALTVMHYLAGRPLFLASDGLVRDAGGSHGHIAKAELFARALDLLASRIAAERPSRVLALFDAPIPKSASHAAAFRAALATYGVDAEARIEANADAPLKDAPAESLVATSDSAVVDALAVRRIASSGPASAGPGVFDAARAAIEALRPGEVHWLDLGAALEEPRSD